MAPSKVSEAEQPQPVELSSSKTAQEALSDYLNCYFQLEVGPSHQLGLNLTITQGLVDKLATAAPEFYREKLPGFIEQACEQLSLIETSTPKEAIKFRQCHESFLEWLRRFVSFQPSGELNFQFQPIYNSGMGSARPELLDRPPGGPCPLLKQSRSYGRAVKRNIGQMKQIIKKIKACKSVDWEKHANSLLNLRILSNEPDRIDDEDEDEEDDDGDDDDDLDEDFDADFADEDEEEEEEDEDEEVDDEEEDEEWKVEDYEKYLEWTGNGPSN